MKTAYILVGVPGSGKSTWAKNQDWLTDAAHISTDVYVQKIADAVERGYSEVFDDAMPLALRLMIDDVKIAQASGKDIVWDQTSTTVSTRSKKIRMLNDYYKIAVVFRTPDDQELQKRLNSREGKQIPKYIQESMASQLKNEPPTLEEGFDEIWEA